MKKELVIGVIMSICMLSSCGVKEQEDNSNLGTENHVEKTVESKKTEEVIPSTNIEDSFPLIDMEQVQVNDFNGKMHIDSEAKMDLENSSTLIWNEDDIVAYYNKKMIPSYIPDGLSPCPKNMSAEVVMTTEGAMLKDEIWLQYYEDYYEDGSPMPVSNPDVIKGFSIVASKLNDATCESFNDYTKTDICGVDVVIGYLNFPYGPYDEDTHEPAGFYDRYEVLFEQDEIHYDVTFSQIELEEVVKVITSLICND